MPVLAVDTPFNIELEFVTAPFAKRLLAWLIDVAIQGAYWLAFYLAVWRQLDSLPENVVKIVSVFGLALPLALYHFLQEVFWSGQSVGKRVLGLRVVRMDGAEPGISQYALRSVLRMLDIGPFVGIPAAVSCGVTRYSQRIGDLVAGTVVIERDAKTDLETTIYRPVDTAGYRVRHPEVMRLTDRDINGIRNLLATKPDADGDAYTAKIAERILHALGIEDEREPRDFLEGLLQDYNALTQKKA